MKTSSKLLCFALICTSGCTKYCDSTPPIESPEILLHEATKLYQFACGRDTAEFIKYNISPQDAALNAFNKCKEAILILNQRHQPLSASDKLLYDRIIDLPGCPTHC